MNIRRLGILIYLHIAQLPMPSKKWRPFFCKLGGVKIKDYKHTFIGANVNLDTNYPEDIIIERGVRITIGGTIVTHFFDTTTGEYLRGQVHIKENAYLGAHVIVCKPVTIGKNAVVGAGSIVTKDIPDNEVWAGNPARFIKKRN